MPHQTSQRPGTVTARPLTFGEIDTLHRGTEPLRVYHLTEGGTLTPATLTVTSRSDTQPVNTGAGGRGRFRATAYFAAKAVEKNGRTTYEPDVERGPVGEYVKVEIADDFGYTRDGGMFTTEEAEQGAALLGRFRDPAATRRTLYVADSKAGTDLPLTPIYGAEATFSVIAQGVGAEEMRERVERALRAEFGDALNPVMKAQSRVVEDRRVNVTDSVDGSPIAVGILAAQVSYVAARRGKNAVTVTTINGADDLVIGA